MGKYVPPVDAAAGAPYVDESPSTGVDGSAVPAAAIEWPQRELDHLISAAGLDPSGANLTQVAEAIAALIAKALAGYDVDLSDYATLAALGAYAKLGVAQLFTKAQGCTPVELFSASGHVAMDASRSNHYWHSLTESTILDNPTNLEPGRGGIIFFIQPASPKALAYGSYWDFSGSVPSTSTEAGAVDALVYAIRTPTSIAARLLKDFK